jgi:hypothetical protein
VILDALLAEGRLTEVALYAGSEAARGIPKFRMRRPAFATTSADELATVIDDSYFLSDLCAWEFCACGRRRSSWRRSPVPA